jgi:cyclic pyranopterin phosphate synthase
MLIDQRPRTGEMIDGHGRRIDYLRLSVTDRCNLRCHYCMAEQMTFLPRRELLTLEELALIADAFIARGVRRIRLSGGEPLVRRDITDLARRIGRHLGQGPLEELTLTTNGMYLSDHAARLADAGVRRINVSLDSLDADRFAAITRGGDVDRVIGGIAAARAERMAVKINMVVLRGINDDEILPMMRWCAREGHDLTLIETMPLGETGEDRTARYIPLHEALAEIRQSHALIPIAHRTGGPARYYSVDGLRLRLGLIAPMSDNFCAGCNRMRVTCQGRIYMCLGHEDHVDLKAAFRAGGQAALDDVLDRALRAKPLRHHFTIGKGAAPATARHMNVTGG